MRKGYAAGNNGKELYWILIKLLPEKVKSMKTEYLFFVSVEGRNLFHLVNTTTCENITDGVHSMK